MPARAARSLLSVLLLSACAGPAAQVNQIASPIDPALPTSIYEYLDTPDAERADQLLDGILSRQDATPEAVSTILSSGRTYRAEAVGVLPSRELHLGGRVFSYGQYVPDSYRPDKAYGLVICLHGAGFTGDAYLERWQARLGEAYILACPTLPMGNWWTRTAEDFVLATIRAVEARYHVDPNRVFLTGMSNGGIGAYLIGAHHASRFAAVVPMAAGLDDILMPFLENFRQTPLYIIHGRQDQVMPVSLSRAIDETLTELGYPHLYREHDRLHPMAGGHFFPREELPDLVAWLADRRRNPYPKKLTIVRDASHLLPFNWARIDATDRIAEFSEDLIDRHDEAIATKRYARLEAEIVGPNTIEVRTHRIRRYTLYFNENLVDLARPVTIMTNGVVTYEGLVVPSTRTLLREARARRDPGTIFSASVSVAVPSSK